MSPMSFTRMGEYDRFAARLLLVALLLRRRAVMPPIACELPYMRKALQARHLRGMEVGCGEARQCAWLPYPHHVEPWCAGVDWLWDVDYRAMRARGEVLAAETAELSGASLGLTERGGGLNASTLGALDHLLSVRDPAARVLTLRGSGGRGGDESVPLGWLPLGGFRTLEWKAPWPRRVEAALRAPRAAGGLALSEGQVRIVKTCLRSLATSKE